MAALAPAPYNTSRYSAVAPAPLAAGLRTKDQTRGHINVAKRVNTSVGRDRQNLMSNNKDSIVYGTTLSAWGKVFGALDAPQNALAFRAVAHRKSATIANVRSEQPNTVFFSFTGLVVQRNTTQEKFEELFQFAGVLQNEYRAEQPGSTVPIAITGLNTVWLGGTDVNDGDRLMWRLPALDKTERDAQLNFEKNYRRNGQHQNTIFPLLERVEPQDVALGPKMWMEEWLSTLDQPSSRFGSLDQEIVKTPFKVFTAFEHANKVATSRDLFLAGQASFVQFVALCSAYAFANNNVQPQSTRDAALALGLIGNQANSNLLKELYKLSFGGITPQKNEMGRKMINEFGQGTDEARKIRGIYEQAPLNHFETHLIAHNYLRNKIILTAAESSPAWGKCDAYN